MNLTAVFEKVPEGYVAFVEELPGANAQGKTLDEARENLREAVEMVIEANRQRPGGPPGASRFGAGPMRSVGNSPLVSTG